MSKGFFKWQRNPFKLWRSYIGALITFFLIEIVFSRKIYIPSLDILVFLLPGVISGFFFGASTKKGKDNFIQYAIFFLLIQILLFLWLIFKFARAWS